MLAGFTLVGTGELEMTITRVVFMTVVAAIFAICLFDRPWSITLSLLMKRGKVRYDPTCEVDKYADEGRHCGVR
jgi:hypothetical protein